MSTIKSSAENLTLNADGANNDIKFQSNGSEVASIDQAGTVTATTFTGAATDATKLPLAGGSMTGDIGMGANDISLNDNGKLKVGSHNDLNIYHDGSNSYIEENTGTGSLILSTNGTGVDVKSNGGENIAKFIKDGAVELYHNNVKKIETTGNGILATGKINVGTSTATSILNVSSTDTGQYAFTLNGARAGGGTGKMIDFHENSFGANRVGSITSGGSSVAYNTSSDYRLKENVDYTWDATTRLKQLKPARFNFIADDTITVDGFIAHEAATVVPECVVGAKDAVDDNNNPEYQGIDQSKLVPLLVKTIQELEARITALEA